MPKEHVKDRGAGWLGVDPSMVKETHVALFVPSRTRDGGVVDHELWRKEAVRVMSEIFGGATSVQGYGGWLDVEQGCQVKEENISVVFSFIREDEWNRENVFKLRDFLYRMGRETQQGEIGVYVRGTYLPIKADRYEHK